MSWDLRSRYAFDASESQIAEGSVSPYGVANAAANCVPASFAAALDLLGFGDIDPQRITNEVFSPSYRGGFGSSMMPAINWIKANVPGAPTITDQPFSFDVAESAGLAGHLIVVAGWIDAPTVTFIPGPASWSHASLLIAHQADDSFVIWNTWTGQLQTYSRSVLAASLYEMAVFQTEDEMQPELQAFIEILALTGDIPPPGGEAGLATIIKAGNKDEVGSQIGWLLGQPAVKAELARRRFMREHLLYDEATGKVTLDPALISAGSPGKDGLNGKDAPPPTDAQVQAGVLAFFKRLVGLA